MHQFRSARLKLTASYVAFVMILSIAFSFGSYRLLIQELDRSLRAQTIRILGIYAIGGKLVNPVDVADTYNESRQRIIYNLFILNGGILLLSAGTSYVLAGKTLAPLERAVDEQKRFIADASHELKTPLTALRTEIEVALRDKKLHIQNAKSLLQSNLEEVDKMKQLTNYLLSLSLYENTNKNLKFEQVRIKDSIDRAVKMVSPKGALRKILIVNEVTDQENFSLYGNAASLEELFVILIDNAIKYSKDNDSVSITTYISGKQKIVEIMDHGIGIKNTDIPYIFNRFYRADTSRTKQKVDGYGLGLSIAKGIADVHNAKIEVESEVGKGSLFRVVFTK